MTRHLKIIRPAAAWLLFLCAPVALAHPDPSGTHGFLHGLLHRLLGPDHLPASALLLLAGAALFAGIVMLGRGAKALRWVAVAMAGGGIYLLAAA